LLVSAPTNKAVSVLATRFLQAVRDDTNLPGCNAIVVGDADKLLGEDSHNNNNNPLRRIFLYTWLSTVKSDYTRIRAYFQPGYHGRDNLAALSKLAVQLEHRLTNSLPYLSKNILNWTRQISQSLASVTKGGPGHGIVETTSKLLHELHEMPNEAVWEALLKSANVIFCTLASAGGTVMKKTTRIDDLIVDEAAAATEPELCIPFHLRPARLLAVGDPLQLPATVLSRRAIDLGLTQSLHERLMYKCDFEHTMLNVQYRMSVPIAQFPSRRFYRNQIGNGPNVSIITGQRSEYSHGPRLLDRLPYTLLQTDGTEQQHGGGSYSNRAEAKKIAELVSHLRGSSPDWSSSKRIRVITFYQAQVGLIQRCLREKGLNNVTVATVDSSQGCEADIVLISFVRTGHDAGFLQDDRRMNVALTRAKYQLVCVGNWDRLGRMKGAETLRLLAADAEERGMVRSPLHNGNPQTLTARLDMFYGQQGDDDDEPAPKKMRHQRG